jgi:soluble lytic murein transglycosylase-like protein
MEQYIRARYTSVPKEVAHLIAKKTDVLCKEHDVSFKLVVGLMEVESRFNPFAKSSSGALGLMQVMPNIWVDELGLSDDKELHDIRTGIESGIQILKHYLEKNNGNVTKALKNYNGTKGDEFHSMVNEHVGRFALFKASRKK